MMKSPSELAQLAPGRCPHCGAPLREERLGVRMTPLKARIFDAIKRGCASSHLREMGCYRTHVYQINDMIAGTGARLAS